MVKKRGACYHITVTQDQTPTFQVMMVSILVHDPYEAAREFTAQRERASKLDTVRLYRVDYVDYAPFKDEVLILRGAGKK